jgi:alcohol dehydrogenase (cytochrome c)
MKLSEKKTAIAVAALAAMAGVALWAPAGFGQAASPQPAAPQAENAPRAAAPALPSEYTRMGLTQPGSIKNYTDVTDAMLTNPSPDDWLMYRGNYAGWSYSSLNQINASNVGQLQLKWTLAMNDGGTNETTPMIHDGVMFLWSPTNMVQAIKADTGELLWQNNLGPLTPNLNPGGDVAERALGLYQDKVIVPTMQG